MIGLGLAVGIGIAVGLLVVGVILGRICGGSVWAGRFLGSVALYVACHFFARWKGLTLGVTGELPGCLQVTLGGLALWFVLDRMLGAAVFFIARTVRVVRQQQLSRRTGVRMVGGVTGRQALTGVGVGALNAVWVCAILILWAPAWAALAPIAEPAVPQVVSSIAPFVWVRRAAACFDCPLLCSLNDTAVLLRDAKARRKAFGEHRVGCADTSTTLRRLVEDVGYRELVDKGDPVVVARQPGVRLLLDNADCARDVERLASLEEKPTRP